MEIAFKARRFFWLKPSCFLFILRPLKCDGNELMPYLNKSISVHCRLASANGTLMTMVTALARISKSDFSDRIASNLLLSAIFLYLDF